MSEDLGVRYANGRPLVPVKTSPQRGQYSFADGVYTFSSGDSRRSLTATVLTECATIKTAEHKVSRNRKRLLCK